MARRSLTALVAFAFVLLSVPLGERAVASTSGVVISEFRFRGPAGGNDEFVELLNASASPVEISGWKLQGCATASGAASDRVTVPAGVTLAAGQHYLFFNSAATAGYSGAVAGDLGYSTGFADGTGARIVNVTGLVLDGVGGSAVGGTQCREGTGIVGMPTANGDQSYERRSGGTQDTDDNVADFEGPKASDPQNRLSGSDASPSITATSPIAGATNVAVDANILITFSEPVNVAASWYSISCAVSMGHTAVASGGPTTFTLDPDLNFTSGEGCTVTVSAAQISDQDAIDPPNTVAADHTFSFTAVAAPLEAAVLISEVYGGGGNAGAAYTNDFIELHNRTSTDASLAGWSVQYGSATGTTWQVTPLTGTIAAGRNYLIQEAAGAGGTTALPSPDVVGTIAMSATSGKVALVSSTTALIGACPVGGPIVDLVGYGAANCSETSATPALSNTTSAQRKAGGAQDTGNNLNDFTVAAPDPHPGRDQAPAVASSVPAAGAAGVARDTNITIMFSEPVTVTGNWYAIHCAASGAHGATASAGTTTFTIDPSSNFLGGETCTVTVIAANVADQDGDDPPDTMAANHVFTFQTIDVFTCGDPATRIHTIQGTGLASPMVGSAATIEGVVVGDYQATPSEFGGFYLQEETADGDDNALTSEGIFVFDNLFGIDVSPGDVVRVRGTVTEFFNLTQLGSVNALVKCSEGASAPATAVSLPVASVSDLERFEGMLVSFDQTLTATEVFNLGRFGEVSLSGVGRLYTPTAVTTPGAAAIAQLAQNNRSRIILDDGNSQQNIDPTRYPQGGLTADNTLRVGDTLSSLTGVMDYRFSNYRIQPLGPITWSHTNPRTAAPVPVGGNLKIASLNVLNFFNGDGLGGGFPTSRGANTLFELQRQLAKEVSALTALNADIVGLMEIENDAGANSALAQLVVALNSALGAGTYSYIDTGVIGTDAIKVALIYKAAAVTPVGAFKTITSAVDPTFIDTLNRPSLAQTFSHTATGQRLTVVVNHLKSKGSACMGDPDTGDGQGNCNLTRTAAAAALALWLGTDPTGSQDPDFLIIGDLNAYTFENPITTLTTSGYVNLVRQFGGLTAYSYVFNGESGYLDHALATASLASQVTGVTDWHINPDEPIVLDYNVEFKTANQVNTFYAPGPYRSSDHDPVVIGLHLNSSPTANANGPYSVAEGASVTLSASATDADADSLIYEWDLDNNGTFETPGQSVTFSAAGIDGPATRTVSVRVTDGEDSTVATTTVNVTNVAPTANANGPYSVGEGASASVTLSASATDADTDSLTYAWDLDNDSTFETLGQSVTFSAAVIDGPATRTVSVRVSDGDDSTVATTTVNVTNVAPTATAGGPYTGAPFAPVTFSGSSTDPAGAADILTYAWDFDYDGTFTADASDVDLRNPSHAYAAPGIYRVALRVTDDDRGVATLAIATVSIGAPTATTGKIEGTPKWGDLLKTKINVHSNATEITGRIDIEGDGWTYASTRLDSIVVTGADATVFGAFGSVTFRLDVHDGGDSGTDTLQLRTSDGYDSGLLTQPRGNLTVFAN